MSVSVNNNKNKEFNIVEFESLDENIQVLIREAIKARKESYCKYSQFAVGACLETKDGKLFRGCNVENGSYGLSICAEKTAIVKAVSEGYRNFKSIAVVAHQENNFTTPCGGCRQFISEFGANVVIYVTRPILGQVLVSTIEHMIPYMFKDLI